MSPEPNPIPPPNFTLRVDHFHHREAGGDPASGRILESLQHLDTTMSELGDYTRQFRAAFDSFKVRLEEDVNELKRRVEAGISTDAEKAEAHALLDDLNSGDVLPDFPAMPEPEPEPEDEPTSPDAGPTAEPR
jgi:hypothetical protein